MPTNIVPPGLFGGDPMQPEADLMTPEDRRRAIAMGFASAAQNVANAKPGLRLGGLLANAVGGYAQGNQAGTADAIAMSGEKRKRAKEDREKAKEQQQEKFFLSYLNGEVPSNLPVTVRKQGMDIYQMYGPEAAKQYTLEALKQQSEQEYSTAAAARTRYGLQPVPIINDETGEQQIAQLDASGGAPHVAEMPTGFRPMTQEELSRQKGHGGEFGKQQALWQAEAPAKKYQFENARNEVRRIDSTARQLLNAPEIDQITGWKGVALAKVPDTKARSLQAKLENIRSALKVRALQDMRNSSPTGGALGNVSDRDIGLLETSIVNLDNAMSAEDFKAELMRLNEFLAGAEQRLTDAYNETYGEYAPLRTGAMPPAPNTGGDYSVGAPE